MLPSPFTVVRTWKQRVCRARAPLCGNVVPSYVGWPARTAVALLGASCSTSELTKIELLGNLRRGEGSATGGRERLAAAFGRTSWCWGGPAAVESTSLSWYCAVAISLQQRPCTGGCRYRGDSGGRVAKLRGKEASKFQNAAIVEHMWAHYVVEMLPLRCSHGGWRGGTVTAAVNAFVVSVCCRDPLWFWG